MLLFIFACFTVFSTWILLAIGGVVNPMGASLACPDWYFVPTCNGEFFPEMVGGVLFEHGHRQWASVVGLLTVVLAIGIWRSASSWPRLKYVGLLAVFLVALQGTLGGITVLLGLSPVISTLHLGIAMVFFCLLIYVSFGLYSSLKGLSVSAREVWHGNRWLQTAFVLTLIQIVYGGFIRHIGAGLACGDDWLFCGPSVWPAWHLGQLHMLHRVIGYLIAVLVAISCMKTYEEGKRKGGTLLQKLAFVPLFFVVAQVALGIMTVATVRSVPVVVAHTAVAALLLASLWSLMLFRASLSLKHISP